MINSEYINKHFKQIKQGGILVVLKKIKSLFFLILHLPIYLISIPSIILIRLISPWFLIRWNELYSNRIGHFAKETELYCCRRDAKIGIPLQSYVDIFFLHKYVSNKQLEKMWKRSLIILPRWLLYPLFRVNRYINTFIKGGDHHEIKNNTMRDVHNLLEKFKPHINFTNDEKIKGKNLLTKLGVPQDAKFVCLNVRDSAYLDRYKKSTLRDWNYHSYRDADIDKYVLAAEELARRGYYILRMGVKVLKPLKSSNPKIIDYVNSAIRSSFMDIYLGAECNFCISTATGFDDIPSIFRKPIAYSSLTPFGLTINHDEKSLILTKHHISKKFKRRLTVSEIFLSNVALCEKTEEYEKNGIELEENSPEEIRDLVVEMDERLNGCWIEKKEDSLLQKKFWSIYEENVKRMKLSDPSIPNEPLYGKIKSRFGAKFLRENKNWIR